MASNFDAKCTRSMRLIWITFHGYITFRYEWPIHATVVFISVLCVMIFWPNASGFSLVFCGTTLEAFDTFAWKGKVFFQNFNWQIQMAARNGFNEWRKLIFYLSGLNCFRARLLKDDLHFHTAISTVSNCWSISGSNISVDNMTNLPTKSWKTPFYVWHFRYGWIKLITKNFN